MIRSSDSRAARWTDSSSSLRAWMRGSTARPSPISPRATAAPFFTPLSRSFMAPMRGSTARRSPIFPSVLVGEGLDEGLHRRLPDVDEDIGSSHPDEDALVLQHLDEGDDGPLVA